MQSLVGVLRVRRMHLEVTPMCRHTLQSEDVLAIAMHRVWYGKRS